MSSLIERVQKQRDEERAALKIVPPAEDTSLPEIEDLMPETGQLANQLTSQPVDQKLANQLTSVANQLTSQPVDQLTSQPVDQLTSYEQYPSRRLRKQKGLRLPAQKLEKWELWCFINKVDFQDAVEIGMDWLTSQPVSHVLNDDFDDNIDDVLNLYRNLTKNKITIKDREARKEIENISADICTLGIFRAVTKSKSKINSFAYCVKTIKQVSLEHIGGVIDLQTELQNLFVGGNFKPRPAPESDPALTSRENIEAARALYLEEGIEAVEKWKDDFTGEQWKEVTKD